MKIRITAGEVTINAEVYDTPTGMAIAESLPLTTAINRWGGEIYFTIPISVSLESDSRDVLEPGELGYWPTGKAFCIFFGATPASQNEECRAASAVNVFGKVSGDLSQLWDVSDGTEIVVEKTAY
ncbi:MAG: hypothetical protein H8E62_03815 [Planctomycetes bacterium]|nr:hypothetical protein [Planctomycetota bacterium]